MDSNDLYATLAQSPIFRGVSTALVSAAAARCEAVILAAHERLLTAGLSNTRLYIVVSGSVSVHVEGTDPASLRLGPGDLVGELSLLDGGPASADVVADQSTVLGAFDLDTLWSMIDAWPEVARNLLRVLAGRTRHHGAALGGSTRLEPPEQGGTSDNLTGLRNRRWMHDAFARQIERTSRSAQPSSILLIDVDECSRLHAEYGPLVADALLCRVASVLSAALRAQDLIARSGREQFALLLPGIDAEATIAIAERLRQTVEAPATGPDGVALPVTTVSIGGTTRRPFEPLPDLLQRAEAVLLRAKQAGRNRANE